jgi:hypothetical protein
MTSVEFIDGMWRCRLPSGVVVITPDKTLLEEYLDGLDNGVFEDNTGVSQNEVDLHR